MVNQTITPFQWYSKPKAQSQFNMIQELVCSWKSSTPHLESSFHRVSLPPLFCPLLPKQKPCLGCSSLLHTNLFWHWSQVHLTLHSPYTHTHARTHAQYYWNSLSPLPLSPSILLLPPALSCPSSSSFLNELATNNVLFFSPVISYIFEKTYTVSRPCSWSFWINISVVDIQYF
jgi:hypothetical protein